MDPFSIFKQLFRASINFIAGLIILTITAEMISWFYLPKPTLHRLPMVKFIADPACGYRLAPNQKAYTLGSLATINQWGFRGKDWTLEKPANTIRVVILGSSYAFGHGVSDDAMYSSQLEQLLNRAAIRNGQRYEVMSFGLGGYDTGHEINVLKAYALKFKPDVVVLSFFFNDIFYIKDYGFYAQMFKEQEQKFSRRAWELRNLMRNSRLAMYLWDEFKDRKGAHEPGEVGEAMNAYVRDGLNPLTQGPKFEEWKLVSDRIREFKALSLENHFKPIFMIIPTHQEMLEENINNSYVAYLRKLGRELYMPPLVTLDAFRATGESLKNYLIPYDYHLSSRGHYFLAQLIEQEISRP